MVISEVIVEGSNPGGYA